MTNPWARPSDDGGAPTFDGPTFEIPLSGDGDLAAPPSAPGDWSRRDGEAFVSAPPPEPPRTSRRWVPALVLGGIAAVVAAGAGIAAIGGDDEASAPSTTFDEMALSSLPTPPTLPPLTVAPPDDGGGDALAVAPPSLPSYPALDGAVASDVLAGFDLDAAVAALDELHEGLTVTSVGLAGGTQTTSVRVDLDNRFARIDSTTPDGRASNLLIDLDSDFAAVRAGGEARWTQVDPGFGDLSRYAGQIDGWLEPQAVSVATVTSADRLVMMDDGRLARQFEVVVPVADLAEGSRLADALAGDQSTVDTTTVRFVVYVTDQPDVAQLGFLVDDGNGQVAIVQRFLPLDRAVELDAPVISRAEGMSRALVPPLEPVAERALPEASADLDVALARLATDEPRLATLDLLGGVVSRVIASRDPSTGVMSIDSVSPTDVIAAGGDGARTQPARVLDPGGPAIYTLVDDTWTRAPVDPASDELEREARLTGGLVDEALLAAGQRSGQSSVFRYGDGSRVRSYEIVFPAGTLPLPDEVAAVVDPSADVVVVVLVGEDETVREIDVYSRSGTPGAVRQRFDLDQAPVVTVPTDFVDAG